MQGQIGRSQSYTIEKLLPNVDDNDEIAERKISKSEVTKALICNSTFTLLVTNSSFKPRCSDTSVLRTVCFLKFVLGDRTESFEFSLNWTRKYGHFLWPRGPMSCCSSIKELLILLPIFSTRGLVLIFRFED